MTTILTFDQSRCRKASRPVSASKTAGGSAEILIFTGVRREPLRTRGKVPPATMHAPMFDDTDPAKPSGRKRRRSKNG